jgi:hypothetical protein
MRRVLGVLVVLVVLVGVGAAPCAAREKIPIYVGGSLFFPTASSTRDAFGGTWPQLSVGWLDTEKPNKWEATFDLSSFKCDDEYEARLIPLTVGVQRGIGSDSTKALQPYVALRAGPYYGRVEAEALGIGETRIGINANAAVGVVIHERYFVEGRYDYFGRVAGFDVGGFSISAGVRVFDL